MLSGDVPECQEGNSPAVQAEGQVLPRGRGRGADPGRHPEAFLPAGEGGHSDRGSLLPPGVGCAAGLLRRPGQVWKLQQVGQSLRLPVLRAPAAQEVSVSWLCLEFKDVEEEEKQMRVDYCLVNVF